MAISVISAVLLVSCITSSASHGSDLVVLTTADRLREEIRSQLDEALEDSLPELCTGPTQNYGSPAQPPLTGRLSMKQYLTSLILCYQILILRRL